MNEEVQLIEGRVSRVRFVSEDSGFCVVDLLSKLGEPTTVVGIGGDLEVDDDLRVSGMFEEHPKFGRRFKATTIQRVTPRTVAGIQKYLAGPRVEGIGPEIAKRLVRTFGEETLRVLDETPERLVEVEGIGKARAEKIRKTWSHEKERRELLVFLQGHGLGPGMAWRIGESLGDEALGRIQKDPYVLVEKVSGIGFRLADRVARSLGAELEDPARLRAGLRHVLDQALVAGDLCLPGDKLLARASELLGVNAAPLRRRLRELVEQKALVIARPRGDLEYAVYDAFAFETEGEAAERLLAHIAAPDPLAYRLPKAAPRGLSAQLSPEQLEAVSGVLGAKVAVLTGGPGVGKTTVLRSLVKIWRDRGLQVALACPTGRAAKRLEEVSGLEALTIHRLLKFDGSKGRFAHGVDFPLRADIVVIDETSMLDLPLFLHLVRSLPEGARLLFVGDADQLPSVGPGTVLRDLIRSEILPVFRLTTVFRQAEGSRIVKAAHEILMGRMPSLDEDSRDLIFIEEEDPVRAAEAMVHLMLDEIPPRFGFEGPSDVQILSPMHRGPTGTTEMNQRIQQARADGSPVMEHGSERFSHGDRVMQVRNDYDRELFNGDLGRVAKVDVERGVLIVRFDGVAHEYKKNQLGDLKPAWAMTVHKSQGGEFPAVILPLYPQHYLLLKRPVLYTAVTRARRLLVLIGDPASLSLAIDSNDAMDRHGFFGHWLAGASPDVWTPNARR